MECQHTPLLPTGDINVKGNCPSEKEKMVNSWNTGDRDWYEINNKILRKEENINFWFWLLSLLLGLQVVVNQGPDILLLHLQDGRQVNRPLG